MASGWRFWIDRGGTFTDVVAARPDGTLTVTKLLSSAPGRYDDAALHAIASLAGAPVAQATKFQNVESATIGTTIGTNALLERKGARTLLVTTRGFADVLRIGSQARPDLFAREIILPAPLHEAVLEIDERIGADGTIVTALDEESARRDLRDAEACGFEAVAIVLVHGDRHPAHEQILARLAREAGFQQVSVSHEVSPLIRYVPRGDVTEVDAYLSPAIRAYVATLSASLGAAQLAFMQSNGGLADAARFRGRDSVLSGPAGGLVGAASVAAAHGHAAAIGFDMGGTSTDVSWWDGTLERTVETVVAGVRLATPMLRVHTVAAGGGSICRFDGARLRVGPESAGAVPGPACYRRGGPLTVTDCNLLLGRVDPARFPHVFGPNGDQPLDRDAVEQKFDALVAEVAAATGTQRSREELAEGFLAIADATMAAAIRRVSIARGHDPSRAALVAFGGAGGQHACAVADAIGCGDVLIHPLAGLLSAWGIAHAPATAVAQRSVERTLDEAPIDAVTDALARQVRAELQDPAAPIAVTIWCKYAGADSPLAVQPGDIVRDFEAAHRRRFGFLTPSVPIVVDSIAVEASRAATPPRLPPPLPTVEAAVERATLVIDGEEVSALRVDRAALAVDDVISGPAIITDAGATSFVAPGWRARVEPDGTLRLTRVEARIVSRDASFDPARLELFNKAFMAVAEEMGESLRASARSTNIKERLDYSCALFDRDGRLIANAPHIPVHLGSMGDAVRAVLPLSRGEVVATNDPYRGGTHLPDITVVAPVFLDSESEPAFYVAARGHHADIGGTTPGSMPADSTSIDEEGARFGRLVLVRDGEFQLDAARAAFTDIPYPARDVAQTIGDLQAQIAAAASGGAALARLVSMQGREAVDAYVGHLRRYAADAVRGLLLRIEGGSFAVTMDSGATIRVRITPADDKLTIDFTGTDPIRPDNSNAPTSIVRAAVLYVLRTLLDDDIPLNDGCLEPVALIVPAPSMLAPVAPAAVVAGNVETSQAVVDCLFGCLGALAASQGTMNNTTFGDGRVQYYETVCGGAGAGPGFAGASAVHTHMTNSRLTDVEILETRYPVRLEQFSIRRGSGGGGTFRGGDGVVRQIRFLRDMTVSVLANRRIQAPFGLAGGGAGARGTTKILRADGTSEALPSSVRIDLPAGAALRLETPGGGGFGEE
ncbi:hydantoinase B/oxoprolinase family protein [Roseiterribacter gracilis]|uniref:5-oxoprolinase n=1 Tax=Roseiterribacter gracilis TaxID=2812848 RepID=A0A8S8X7Q0_9PROT|nr:5-oxoprolinase [Rhodospirillales bacterium TMPK1]